LFEACAYSDQFSFQENTAMHTELWNQWCTCRWNMTSRRLSRLVPTTAEPTEDHTPGSSRKLTGCRPSKGLRVEPCCSSAILDMIVEVAQDLVARGLPEDPVRWWIAGAIDSPASSYN